MSMVNKLFGGGAKLADKLVEKTAPSFRFGGFQTMGAHPRPADTRTTEQLLANIDYFADKFPDINNFRKELKEMNPKFLGVTSDIFETITRHEFLMTNQDCLCNANGGRSVLKMFTEKLPKLVKENPEYMSFAEKVVNNTDSSTIKYFVSDSIGIRGDKLLERDEYISFKLHKEMEKMKFDSVEDRYQYADKRLKELEAQYPVNVDPKNLSNAADFLREELKTVENAIPIVGQATLNRGYLGTLEPQFNFMRTLKRLLVADTPTKQMKENIDVLPQVMKNGRSIDIVDFVTKNVNLD